MGVSNSVHIVYFSTVKVFFLLDSDLGTGWICLCCALLSVPGARAAHLTADVWTRVCLAAVLTMKENTRLC